MVDAKENSPNTDNAEKKHIRGSSFLFVGRLIAIILKAIMQILVVRYLVKEDYGAYAYVLNFIDIIAIISIVGLDQSTSRYIPVFLGDKDYDSFFGVVILSIGTILAVGLGLVAILISTQTIFLDWLISDQLTLDLLLLLIILAPMQSLDTWFQSLFAAFTNVKAIFFRRYILSPGLQLLVIIIVIATQSGVYELSIGYLIAGIAGVLLYISLLFSLLKRENLLDKFNLRTLKFHTTKIFGFSLPILGSATVLLIRSQFATIFLEFFVSVSAVAEYRAVQPIARLNSVVYQSFVFLYLPLASRLINKQDGEGINTLYWRTTSWIALASFPAFIVSFAMSPQLVPLLFGDQYSDAAILMSIMAVGYYVNALLGFNLYTVRAYDKLRYLFTGDIIVMIVAIITYFTLLPSLGSIGAALSFTIGIITANIINHIGMARYSDVNLFDSRFLPVYLSLLIAATGITLFQIVFNPSIFIAVPLAGIVWLFLLRWNASILQVGEIFPELLKVPILRDLIQP